MTRILIADDHPLFRLALAQTARDAVAGAVVDEAATLDEAKARLAAHPDTDLVLLDLHMPGSHGLMGLAALRAAHPAVAVAMISAHDDPATVRRALAHGACAYIPKRLGLDPLRAALGAVLACETWLPPGLHEDDSSPAAEDRALAARLASLTPQQLGWFFLLLCVLSLSVGLFFWSQGAKVVLLFTALESAIALGLPGEAEKVRSVFHRFNIPPPDPDLPT